MYSIYPTAPIHSLFSTVGKNNNSTNRKGHQGPPGKRGPLEYYSIYFNYTKEQREGNIC